MTHGKFFLEQLYNDLLNNVPQTISMDIPSDIGIGHISQTTLKHGIIISDWQINYHSNMDVQGANSREYIQIIFCMNGGISWEITHEPKPVCIQEKETCIYSGHGQIEHIYYPKGKDFSFKSIKIPIDYLSQLLSDYFGRQETTVYKEKLLTGISKIPVTPAMERILTETKDFTHYRGGLGYIYLDGKILELLSIYLGEILDLSILIDKTICMTRTEQTAIMEAKRIIDSELAYAPDCEALSKLVHINIAKLAKGFSSLYGVSIHQYIIEQRLTKAAQLLIEYDCNVGEIATIVGYNKPSNFSAAFKRKYGILPKDYRATQAVR